MLLRGSGRARQCNAYCLAWITGQSDGKNLNRRMENTYTKLNARLRHDKRGALVTETYLNDMQKDHLKRWEESIDKRRAFYKKTGAGRGSIAAA